MEYYVVSDKGEEGPFDLVSIVKRVRGGKVTRDTLIRNTPGGEALPAAQVPTMAEFFVEHTSQASRTNYEEAARKSRTYDLKQTFVNGVNFLKLNQAAAVYTGLYLIVTIATIAIFRLPGIAGALITACLCYILFSGFLFIMLKRSRGQMFNLLGVIQEMKSHFLPLLLAGAIVSTLTGIGLVLLIGPGLLVLTCYIFTPLLILEKNMSFWEAMETSRKTVLNMGSHNMGVLLALVVANFLATILFLFPLLLTLPITTNALSEIYDDLYS